MGTPLTLSHAQSPATSRALAQAQRPFRSTRCCAPSVAACSARPPRPQPTAPQVSTLAWQPLAAALLAALPAAADEAPAAVAQSGGGSVNLVEVVILAAPLLLYGVFNLYRDKVNPAFKLTDFIFILAAIVIVLNILSILVFKVRIF
ncbi:hypothetical protein WJX81_000967 [Elliptochloris bilobata]|uniref:Uncharacterized protein n=1 Tax=Elliptochloris bilobata TaxID=381761 RepID=A0AAW1RL46_9CHLO